MWLTSLFPLSFPRSSSSFPLSSLCLLSSLLSLFVRCLGCCCWWWWWLVVFVTAAPVVVVVSAVCFSASVLAAAGAIPSRCPPSCAMLSGFVDQLAALRRIVCEAVDSQQLFPERCLLSSRGPEELRSSRAHHPAFLAAHQSSRPSTRSPQPWRPRERKPQRPQAYPQLRCRLWQGFACCPAPQHRRRSVALRWPRRHLLA